MYKETKKIGKTVKDAFKPITEDFCYLFTGHWLGGTIGQDRKDVGMLIKVFLETFKKMLQEILPKRNKAKEHSYNESINIQFAIKII